MLINIEIIMLVILGLKYIFLLNTMKCKLKPMLGKISLPGSLEMREENNVYYKCRG